MKCETSDLEIETLYNRIKNKDVNLQPDFQRGEVWSTQKKKKLIDSILRGWKIPPIHFVQGEDAVDEVLDGQQRLVSIRDFIDNEISIDGKLTPLDEDIQSYHGKIYSELPEGIQRKFRKYIIIIVRLSEFCPEEPAELFYRLNQPATLTSAEQRNAFIGKTRDQIKNLVELFTNLGADKDIIGFSNSRLAYDEVISKFCYAIELHTLRHKIAAPEISEKYRSDIPFSKECYSIAQDSIQKFMLAVREIMNISEYKLKFNKATLFSWFVFIKSRPDLTLKQVAETILKFELGRDYLKGKLKNSIYMNFEMWYMERLSDNPFLEIMINTFNQRASMGSTDAISIIYRDIILHVFCDIVLKHNTELLSVLLDRFSQKQNLNYALESIYDQFDWGGYF